jgi:two-component system CheB/CheR fusion protein
MPNFPDDIRTVLSNGSVIERPIARNVEGPHYLVRMLPYRDVDGATDGVVITFIDVTVLSDAEARQRTLIAELNHRVKNMLSIVQAIAEQTLRRTSSVTAFKAAFMPRLHAMGQSYELLSRENWTEASIEDMARQELAPFGEGQVIMDGPPLRLKPQQALSLGMILHELATNAAKYGALSVAEGRVSLAWSREPRQGADRIEVRWSERDGPAAEAPEASGFGLTLVEREAKYSLGGAATIDFASTGLEVSLQFNVIAGGR